MKNLSRSEIYDVVVIGGGPSGLFVSNLLSKNGINTILIEKDSEIGKDVVCSGVISKEAFERYRLPENSIVGTLQDAELHSPGGVNIPYTHPEEAVVVVDRHQFDGELGKISAQNGTKFYSTPGSPLFRSTKIMSMWK